MKYLFLIATFFISSTSFAEVSKNKNLEFPGLDAESVEQVIRPIKVEGNISTPYAVWFYKKGDLAPSCSLIDSKKKSVILELVGPSDDRQFANCAQKLKDPLIFKVDQGNYAVYSYVSEETRGELSNGLKIVTLKEDAFYLCKEDSKISTYIESNSNKHAVDITAVATAAVKKLGCTAEAVAP